LHTHPFKYNIYYVGPGEQKSVTLLYPIWHWDDFLFEEALNS